MGYVRKKITLLAKDSVVYGVGSFLLKLIPFITVPIYTHIFSLTEYGVLGATIAFTQFFYSIFAFGMDSAVARFFFDDEKIEYKKTIVSIAFIFQTGITVVIIFLFSFFLDQIFSFYFNELSGLINKWLVLITLPFQMYFLFSINLLRWRFKKYAYNILVLTKPVIQTIICLVIVLLFYKNINAVFLGILITTIIYGLIGIILNREYIRLRFDVKYFKEMIKFSYPYGFASLFKNLTPSIDKFFITNFIGGEALGFYVLAHKLAGLTSLIKGAFDIAWGPLSYSIYKDKDSKFVYRKVFSYYMVLNIIMLLAITLFKSDIVNLFVSKKEYLAGLYLVPFLLLANYFENMLGITMIGINLTKKTIYVAISYLLSILGMVLTNLVVLDSFTIIVPAISLVVAQAINYIALSYWSEKYYPIGFAQQRFVLSIILYILGVLVIDLIFSQHFPFKYIFMLLYLPLIGLLLFARDDKEKLLAVTKSKFQGFKRVVNIYSNYKK